MLNNGKQFGKVKGTKCEVTSEAEQKMTNDERIKLIIGAINQVGTTGSIGLYDAFRDSHIQV